MRALLGSGGCVVPYCLVLCCAALRCVVLCWLVQLAFSMVPDDRKEEEEAEEEEKAKKL